MTDFSEALMEAYASVPEVAIIEGLTISHSAFGPDDPLRFANTPPEGGEDEDEATLQSIILAVTDVANASHLCIPFGVAYPGHTEGRVPEARIWVDNATGHLDAHIEAATMKTPREQIIVDIRVYLVDDLLTVQYALENLIVSNIEVTGSRVTATLTQADYGDMPFPGLYYYREDFPGLAP